MEVLPLRGAGAPPARESGPETRDRAGVRRESRRRRVVFLGALAALFLLLTACYPNDLQSTWGPAGPVAAKQLQLFNLLLWVMVVIFVVVEGVLLYAVIRYRRRPGQGLPPQVHGNTTLEITWTIIPTVLILALGIWSVFTLFELNEPPVEAGEPLQVVATGHQWWFEFEYPNADGDGKVITTANELRVPVNRAVKVDLRSDDVIHSFWIPKLAGKLDMVPTRTNRMWFLAEETGAYFGQCAEFCGTAHALMRFRVQVLTEADYDAWVAGYGQTPQLSPLAVKGQQLFLGNCSMCHTANGPDAAAVMDIRVKSFLDGAPIAPGPNLTDLATRTTIGAGLLDRNEVNLRTWLNNPLAVKPGNHMAGRASIYSGGAISLSGDDVSALIEYLQSLK